MRTLNKRAQNDPLRAAMKSRALAVAAMHDEIEAEFGADKAREICKRAICKPGEDTAAILAPPCAADLSGLLATSLDVIPQRRNLFEPEVVECTDDELVIQFHRCPLKEAWQEAGYEGSALARLCDIAGLADAGSVEGVGVSLHAETWQPGRAGCCRLHIRTGAA